MEKKKKKKKRKRRRRRRRKRKSHPIYRSVPRRIEMQKGAHLIPWNHSD